MSRHMFLTGALAALFACQSGAAPETPAAVLPGAAIKILAFGDSLTAGKDLEDPDTQAYPAFLEKALKAKGRGVSVINAGHSGDTTFDGLARLDYSLAEKPQVVIIALGSNDTFQGKTLKDIESNLSELVRRSKAAGAVVVLAGMKTFPNLGPFYAGGYDKLFPRVAEKQGAILVPFMLQDVAGAAGLNLSDGIHPNPQGHERIAKTLLPFVERALKEAKL